jgi:hypothetical protein
MGQLGHDAAHKRLGDQHFLLNIRAGQPGALIPFGKSQDNSDCIIGLAVDFEHFKVVLNHYCKGKR